MSIDLELTPKTKRERSRDRRPGHVVERHPRDILRCDAVVGPTEAQRVEDLLGEHRADVLTGHPMDNLAQDVAARDGVIEEKPPRLGEWPCVAKDPNTELAITRPVEVQCHPREIGHPGAMREHLTDRDLALTVTVIPGNVLADAVRDVQRPALVEHVDHKRRDRLRGGIDEKRRRRRRRPLLYPRAITRAVAASMTDRAVKHHRALATHAHLHGRVDSASIKIDGRAPDALHRLPAHATSVGALPADRGDRLEVARDAHPSQRIRQPGHARNRQHPRHGHALQAQPAGRHSRRSTSPSRNSARSATSRVSSRSISGLSIPRHAEHGPEEKASR